MAASFAVLRGFAPCRSFRRRLCGFSPCRRGRWRDLLKQNQEVKRLGATVPPVPLIGTTLRWTSLRLAILLDARLLGDGGLLLLGFQQGRPQGHNQAFARAIFRRL